MEPNVAIIIGAPTDEFPAPPNGVPSIKAPCRICDQPIWVALHAVQTARRDLPNAQRRHICYPCVRALRAPNAEFKYPAP